MNINTGYLLDYEK